MEHAGHDIPGDSAIPPVLRVAVGSKAMVWPWVYHTQNTATTVTPHNR